MPTPTPILLYQWLTNPPSSSSFDLSTLTTESFTSEKIQAARDALKTLDIDQTACSQFLDSFSQRRALPISPYRVVLNYMLATSLLEKYPDKFIQLFTQLLHSSVLDARGFYLAIATVIQFDSPVRH